MKVVCSKCNISGSLKAIQKVNKLQPNFLNGEIDHNVIIISKYKEYGISWKHCFLDVVLGLAYVVAKHGNDIRKIIGVSYENTSTESSLG